MIGAEAEMEDRMPNHETTIRGIIGTPKSAPVIAGYAGYTA